MEKNYKTMKLTNKNKLRHTVNNKAGGQGEDEQENKGRTKAKKTY